MHLIIGPLSFNVTVSFLQDLRKISCSEFPLAQVAQELHVRGMLNHFWYGDRKSPDWATLHWDHLATLAGLSDNMLLSRVSADSPHLFREGLKPLQLTIEENLIVGRILGHVVSNDRFARLFPTFSEDNLARLKGITDLTHPEQAAYVVHAQSWLNQVHATRQNITQLVLVLIT